jgi:glutamyl-tRNA synthetase
MVLGSDRSRLSKRHGAMSVSEYRSMGYLPDAMINYLVRLGWSHGDQEFFEREELIEKFDLAHLGRSAAMFDPDRLSALNAKHIQAKSPEELGPYLLPYLESNDIDAADDNFLHEAIKTLQPRSRTLVDMAQNARFYFTDKIEYDEAAAKKFLTEKTVKILESTLEAISGQDEFTLESLESAFKQVMEKTGLGFGKIAQPVRVAVTGTTVSPGIFEMLLVLGRDQTLARIKAAADTVKND